MQKAREILEAGSTKSHAEPILTWKVHLLREQPVKLLLVIPAAALSLVASYVLFRTFTFGLIALFLILASLAEYLFPIRFEIDSQGASARTLTARTRIEWSRVKKYYLDDRGIKLSPLSRQTRLEAYRGVYLMFGNRRDEVIEAVKEIRDAVQTRGAD
jgi:hypothetical protein